MSGSAAAQPATQLDIFFNTNHSTAEEVKERRMSAGRQNRAILSFFRDNPAGCFTPFEVQQHTNLGNVPITSIRRAISTLTQSGYLVKTDVLKDGEFGAKNHTWRLA